MLVHSDMAHAATANTDCAEAVSRVADCAFGRRRALGTPSGHAGAMLTKAHMHASTACGTAVWRAVLARSCNTQRLMETILHHPTPPAHRLRPGVIRCTTPHVPRCPHGSMLVRCASASVKWCKIFSIRRGLSGCARPPNIKPRGAAGGYRTLACHDAPSC